MTTPKDSMEERLNKRFVEPLDKNMRAMNLNGNKAVMALEKEMVAFIRSELSLALKSERQRVVEMVRGMKRETCKSGCDCTRICKGHDGECVWATDEYDLYNKALSDIIARIEAERS